jgi:hypothetical protein
VHTDRDERFFFVHVMKTGGTSLVLQMHSHFAADEIYPNERLDRRHRMDPEPYASLPDLLALTHERRAAIRVYAGHFPFMVRELLGADVVTLTLLRDPVDRTISVLKHFKRLYERYGDDPLGAVYDDELVFRNFVENYQTRMFALTAADHPVAFAGRVPYRDLRAALERPRGRGDDLPPGGTIAVDDDRLAHAKANLARTDIVGVCEDYGMFVEMLRSRFGWWPDGVDALRANVSEEAWDVDPALRRRIAADNAFDVELYEHARELVAARRG